MKISISQPLCYTAQGEKPNQEDSLFPRQGEASKTSYVFLVCDGMGGHENGEVASACVAETVGRMTSEQPLCTTAVMRDSFERALQQAYCNLDALDRSDSPKKMGTTLTFLAICTDGVLVAHIGDSRIYQLRPGKGVVFQTRDHSLVSELVAAGELSEEEAKTFPRRNVITRAIQPHQECSASASYNILNDIRKGDLFFLCCDGVLEKLDNNDLCSFLLNDRLLASRIATVEEACACRGTNDNNSAYLIEISDVTPDDAERQPFSDDRTLTSSVTRKYGGIEHQEEMTGIADDEMSPCPVPTRKGWWGRLRFWIILPIVLIALLFVLFELFPAIGSKNDEKQEMPHQSQVNDTITKQKTPFYNYL